MFRFRLQGMPSALDAKPRNVRPVFGKPLACARTRVSRLRNKSLSIDSQGIVYHEIELFITGSLEPIKRIVYHDKPLTCACARDLFITA